MSYSKVEIKPQGHIIHFKKEAPNGLFQRGFCFFPQSNQIFLGLSKFRTRIIRWMHSKTPEQPLKPFIFLGPDSASASKEHSFRLTTGNGRLTKVTLVLSKINPILFFAMIRGIHKCLPKQESFSNVYCCQ